MNFRGATPGGGTLVLASFCLMLWCPAPAAAQGGISGTKIVTPNALPVPEDILELEPYVTLRWSSTELDEGWSRRDASELTEAEMGFRFTAGLTPSLEVGLMLPIVMRREVGAPDNRSTGVDLGDIPVGAKWQVLGAEVVSLAVVAGVTTPTGNSTPGAGELGTGDGLVGIQSGLVATFQLTERLSIDADVVGGIGMQDLDAAREWGLGMDVAVGYQWPTLQPVLELNYAVGASGESHTVATTVGFTYDLNDRVIIVTGLQVDLVGRNERAGVTYSLAFTTSL